jgi:glycerate-2-kinase
MPPITLDEKIQTTNALLACGADIHEINTMRKHISAIKGGGLARAAYPATLVMLAISDVVGDKISSIGSGPTTGDPTTFKEARKVIRKYDLESALPRSVLDRIEKGCEKQIEDTPYPNDPIFTKNIELIIGSNRQAIEAAREAGIKLGYDVEILTSQLTGEASEIGTRLANNAVAISQSSTSGDRTRMLISGGETTVTLRGSGKGGRNQEMALATAIALDGHDNIIFASIGTDGTDGPTDAAGAYADGSTLEIGRQKGMNARDYLKNNNSYEYFDNIGYLIKTGPTGTNVMDIQIIIIG